MSLTAIEFQQLSKNKMAAMADFRQKNDVMHFTEKLLQILSLKFMGTFIMQGPLLVLEFGGFGQSRWPPWPIFNKMMYLGQMYKTACNMLNIALGTQECIEHL